MQDEQDLDASALVRLQRIGGDRLLCDMLALFLQHAPVKIATALSAQRDGDYHGIEQAVHALKSSAGNVGARRVQQLAEAIERMAGNSEAERIGSALLELQNAFDRLEPQLRQATEGLS